MGGGGLDPALVGTGWRLGNRRSNTGADNSADSPQVAAALAGIASGGAPHSLAEAERIKENYLAELRRLEFEQKSGALVTASDVAKLVGEDYAAVRKRLLAIPAERAPALYRLGTVAEVEDALRGFLTEALEELCDE